jgi:phospholipase/carboxylesterase
MPMAGGKSWYKAKAVDPLTEETRASLAEGLATFDAVLAAERAAHPGVPVVAAGFSQGACMVAEWVLRGAVVEGLGVFTGCRVGAFDQGEPARGLGGLPVYASCGDQDSWIPLPAFMGMCGVFGASGARLRADVLPGRPHDICPNEVAEFSRMLAAVADGRPVMAEGMA